MRQQPNRPMVEYTCEGCGAKFQVQQGSRARFCDACYGRRVRSGRRKKKQREQAIEGYQAMAEENREIAEEAVGLAQEGKPLV